MGVKISAQTELGTATTADQLAVASGTSGDFKKTLNSQLVAIFNNALEVGKFTKEKIFTGQTITSAALLTLAHGFGIEPKLVALILQCTTSEHNFSIGNRIFVGFNNSDAGASRYNLVEFDTTNVFVRYSNDTFPFIAANKTTGVKQALTKANWQLYVEAWA